MFGSLLHRDAALVDHFNRLGREMADLLDYPASPTSIRAVAHGSFPAINVGSTSEGVEVFVFAPGLDQGALDLSIQQNLLTISGSCPERHANDEKTYLKERFVGDFKRSLSLPEDIDPESATARYANGVLQISLRRKAETKPRKIEIN